MYVIVLPAVSLVILQFTFEILGWSYLVPRHSANKVEVPWWSWPLFLGIWFVLVVVGSLVLHLTLYFAEYLAYYRRRCPQCGTRRWSWGYQSGFGL